jgi:hypothetical protein
MTRKIRLHGQRGLAHLVEKHRSTVGILEQARPRIRRSSKRPAHVPKELTFQQRIDHRRAVAHRQPLRAHRTEVVNGPRHQLLACARRPGHQYVGVMPRDLARKIEHFQHRGTFPHDAVKFQVLQ